MRELERFPPRRIINPLFALLYSTDESIKWRAVTAFGAVAAGMAKEDPEAARNVMRRLIWNLNDESGGIGWGSAEAMGETMARDERMTEEFSCILHSYISEQGNKLENAMLERGVLWGLGRLAQARPAEVEKWIDDLVPYLSSQDPVHRGFAAWTLGFLDTSGVVESLKPLLGDPHRILLYDKGELTDIGVDELAARALASLRRPLDGAKIDQP